MKMAIVRYEAPRPPCDPFDIFLAAMMMMYVRAPLKRNADVDGFYELGEIGGVAEKRWSKRTPYSPAEVVPAEPEKRLLTIR